MLNNAERPGPNLTVMNMAGPGNMVELPKKVESRKVSCNDPLERGGCYTAEKR
jgi:hypothetical protein